MLQDQEVQPTEIKAPSQGARIKLTPEEIETLNAAAEKSCLCHDSATNTWMGTCTPSSIE